MFNVNDKVVYPTYGTGKVTKKFEREFNGDLTQYLEIQLDHHNYTIDIPAENAISLGVRSLMNENEIKAQLNDLTTEIKLTNDDKTKIDKYSHAYLKSGKFKEAVELVKLLRSLSKERRQENKTLTFTQSSNLDKALKFIKAEVLAVLGKDAINNHSLLANVSLN